jgi:hypothetical protein
MVYNGTVKNGVVVFAAGSPPEGVSVRVAVANESAQFTAGTSQVLQQFKKYSGVLKDLPADLAKNHNHYIHSANQK